jgi:ABC-2 type transport system ATP-binding protein
MISAKGVAKVVGGRALVDNVTFDVGSGEWLGLASGPLQPGIVLLRILATLLRPTSGLVQIDGIDIVRRPFEARQRLLYAGAGFSGPYAADGMTPPGSQCLRVDEYLSLLARVRGVESRADTIAEAIQGVELKPETGVEDLRAEERAGVVLAAVRLLQPKVVLIEDPAGLAFNTFVKQFGEADRASCSVVVSSSDNAMLEKHCQRVINLDTRRFGTDASEHGERATRTERADEAARERACGGVRGA